VGIHNHGWMMQKISGVDISGGIYQWAILVGWYC